MQKRERPAWEGERGRGRGVERDDTSTYQHNLSNCARSHGLMVSGIVRWCNSATACSGFRVSLPGTTCTNARALVLSTRITPSCIANHR